MRLIILVLSFLWITQPFIAQQSPESKKGKQFYFSWGYTRAKYGKSSIRLQNSASKSDPGSAGTNYYDFTIHDAVAHDRPDFDKIRDFINFTVPQYVYRLGYSVNKNWGIEFNFDHTKYIVDDWQRLRISGNFNDSWVDNDTILNPNNLLHFEHSDGANFGMVNFVRRWDIFKPAKNLKTQWVVKAGAGIVAPRTDVTLFGTKLNNDYKIAGWIAGIESGLRLNFLKYGFFEFVAKGTYADFINAFVLGKGNGKASHHFYTGQLTATLGFRIDKQ